MVNMSGEQPNIKCCPIYKGNLENVPRSKMKSKGYIKKMVQFRSILIHMIALLAKIDLRLIRIDKSKLQQIIELLNLHSFGAS